MPYPPLSLIKRLVKGIKVLPSEEDQNYTDIETAVNGQDAKLAVALNPNGTIKNNAVSTASIQDRAVTLNKLAFESVFYAIDTGAVNAAVISFAPLPLSAYVAGDVFWVKIIADNTGAATLNVDGLGPKNIKVYTSTGIGDPVGGNLKAGGVYVFIYDGTNFVLLNPSTVASVPVVNVDSQTLNTRMGSDVTFPHPFGVIPFSKWYLRCTDAGGDGGFAFNDEVDIAGVWYETTGGGNPDYEPLATTWANTSIVGVGVTPPEGADIGVVANKGGLEPILVQTKWKLVNRAVRLF